MNHRRLLAAGALAVVIAAGSPVVVPVAGQAHTAATATYTPPRTPWGDPDLQGVYDYQTLLTLERPPEMAGKVTRTDEEQAAWYKERARNTEAGGWNISKYIEDNRTSLITDPPDGRIPLTAEGAKRYLALEEYRRIHQQAYDTWAEIGSYERCISRVIPRLWQQYNGGAHVFQSPGYVTIVHEQLDTVIIPLDRPHVDQKVRQWNGDARGHWEGNTLVVETTNFTDKQTAWPPMRDSIAVVRPSEGIIQGQNDGLGHTGVPRGNLKMTERYTPLSATRLEYTVTNEDPTWFSRPWTFMLPWQKQADYTLYEYACNEGNLAAESSLRGARIQEINGKPYQPPAEPGGDQRNGRPLHRVPR